MRKIDHIYRQKVEGSYAQVEKIMNLIAVGDAIGFFDQDWALSRLGIIEPALNNNVKSDEGGLNVSTFLCLGTRRESLK